jgi:hypothetical protein
MAGANTRRNKLVKPKIHRIAMANQVAIMGKTIGRRRSVMRGLSLRLGMATAFLVTQAR